MKIDEVAVACSNCGWCGQIKDTEPDIDGEGNMGCPICLSIVKEIGDQSFKHN